MSLTKLAKVIAHYRMKMPSKYLNVYMKGSQRDVHSDVSFLHSISISIMTGNLNTYKAQPVVEKLLVFILSCETTNTIFDADISKINFSLNVYRTICKYKHHFKEYEFQCLKQKTNIIEGNNSVKWSHLIEGMKRSYPKIKSEKYNPEQESKPKKKRKFKEKKSTYHRSSNKQKVY